MTVTGRIQADFTGIIRPIESAQARLRDMELAQAPGRPVALGNAGLAAVLAGAALASTAASPRPISRRRLLGLGWLGGRR